MGKLNEPKGTRKFNGEEYTISDMCVPTKDKATKLAKGYKQADIKARIIPSKCGFNIAFLGYGTMFLFYLTQDWTAPSDFGWCCYNFGYIDEFLYFRCYENNAGDLNHPPAENPFIGWPI
jgi:hypothetical protein